MRARPLDFVIPILLIALAAAPIAALFLSGYEYFSFSREFIGYRIGDAVSIMAGESARVRPVQGLPTAIVSKFIVEGLYRIYGPDIASVPVIQLYCALFFAAMAAFIAGGVVWNWSYLDTREQIGLAVMMLMPFYGIGAAPILLAAPDYWIGEYAFLVVSAPLLARAPTMSETARTDFLLGAWAAIGIAIKITLFPVGLLMFVARKGSGLTASRTTAGAIVTYLLLALVYLDFSRTDAIGLLWNQAAFFLNPNQSHQYSGLLETITALPSVAFLGLAALAAGVASRTRTPAHANVALAWILLYVILIGARPHQSSTTSAALGFLFIIAVSLPNWRTAALAYTIAAGALIAPLAVGHRSNLQIYAALATNAHDIDPSFAKVRDFVASADIVYVPTNLWVSPTPLQVIGYNGGLGGYKFDNNPVGRLDYVEGAKAFRLLFPNQIMAWADAFAKTQVPQAVRAGQSLAWTYGPGAKSAEDDHYSVIRTVCAAPDIECSEEPLPNGWTLGRALVKKALTDK